jgi:hypothetical protein
MGCGTAADTRYCDDTHECADPRWPECDRVAHQCVAAPDGAVASPDGGADARARDGASDSGCPAGTHSCTGGCYADDDAAHCGTSCVACGPSAPACVAGGCVCTETSCGPGSVCTDGSCVAAPCAGAGDCVNPPACHVAAGATCVSNTCLYPVMADGAACGAGHQCCSGQCVANDGEHCGPACLSCGGDAPACDGTSCACTATSCSGGSVCAAGACVSGTCTTAADCQSPPSCRTTGGAICNASHVCEYPRAADGATCNASDHCCSGTCVANDTAHCGASCQSCTPPDNAAPLCVTGDHCDFECQAGFWREGDACSACATATHCGAACEICVTSVAHADPACILGACDFTCQTRYWRSGGACVLCNSPEHCTDACTSCDAGALPACAADGSACVCTVTSCDEATPICDAGGACRACGGHAECEVRDAQQPLCFSGTCHPSVCGDGYIDAARGEVCEDGNTNNGDGCDPTCRYTGGVTTIAGQPGANDGAFCDDEGVLARFDAPGHMAVSGNLVFVADRGSQTIRQVDVSDPGHPVVTTLAGTPGQAGHADGATGSLATFFQPTGVATDGTYVYVADMYNHTIRRVAISGGATTTIAGLAGVAGFKNDVGTAARFYYPQALGFGSNYLYVADSYNCVVRKIDLVNNSVTTFAGTDPSPSPICGYSDTWPGQFNHPYGLAVLGAPPHDSVLVADTWNSVVRWAGWKLVSISPPIWDKRVETWYGTAGAPEWQDGNGTAARFRYPAGVAIGPSSVAYIADTDNHVIRTATIDASRTVTTWVGHGEQAGATDGYGTAAYLRSPWGIATSGTAVFVSEPTLSSTLRRTAVSDAGTSTLAGTAPHPGFADTGQGTLASPWGIATEGDGTLLVGDHGNCTLREIGLGSSTVVSTLAGVPGNCVYGDGTFRAAYWAAAVGGLAYVADLFGVRSVDLTSGVIGYVAGTGSAGTGDNANGLAAGFTLAQSAVADAQYLYVGDQCAIRRVTLGGLNPVVTLVGQVGSCGAGDGVGAAARLRDTIGLELVGTWLYVTDTKNFALRRIDISNPAATHEIHTVAGYLGSAGHQDGDGTGARFLWPAGLAFDGRSLFVADRELIRQVDPATLRVTTLTGRLGCQSTIDGAYTRAALNTGAGLTYNPITRKLYLADYAENVIREIE